MSSNWGNFKDMYAPRLQSPRVLSKTPVKIKDVRRQKSESPPSQANVMYATKIQFLEEALNLLFDSRAELHPFTVLILHKSLSSRLRHPLVRLAFEKCDVVAYSRFGFVAIWKATRKKRKSPRSIGFFPELNLLLAELRHKFFKINHLGLLRKLGLSRVTIIADLGDAGDVIQFSALDANIVSITHGVGIVRKSKSEKGNSLEISLNQILDAFPSTDPPRLGKSLFLHKSQLLELPSFAKDNFQVFESKRLNYGYRNHIENHTDAARLKKLTSGKKFALLISRPSQSGLSGQINPMTQHKKTMMRELKSEILNSGMHAVILPHPTERNRFWHRFDFLWAPGWKVADDVHYLSLIQRAEVIFTFGGSLVDDCQQLGKKAILYRTDLESDLFHTNSKSVFVNSNTQMREILDSM